MAKESMTSKEEAAFRALYAQWPIERLARASTLEKQDYRPEAVLLMLEELKKRGVAEEYLPTLVASTPPPLSGRLPVRDTLLFPARLDRRSYVVRAFVFLSIAVAAAVALEMVPILQPAAFVVLLLATVAYGAIGLLLPRSKDAGFSPGVLGILFCLFPITGFGAFVVLFFLASKS